MSNYFEELNKILRDSDPDKVVLVVNKGRSIGTTSVMATINYGDKFIKKKR
jgi:hypothetical protein